MPLKKVPDNLRQKPQNALIPQQPKLNLKDPLQELPHIPILLATALQPDHLNPPNLLPLSTQCLT